MPLKPPHIVYLLLCFCLCSLSFQLQAQTTAIKYDSIATFYYPDSIPESHSNFGRTLAHTKGWYIATKVNNEKNTELDIVFMKEDSISGLITRSEIKTIESLANSPMALNSVAADSFYFIYVIINYRDQSGNSWIVPRLEVFKLNTNDEWKPHQSIALKTSNKYGIISLAADQQHLVVGAYSENTLDNNKEIPYTGKVYVYDLSSDNDWIYSQTLNHENYHKNDHFGYSVSIYQNKIAVSAPDRGPKNNEGVVYIYEHQENGAWLFRDSFKTNNQNQILFGQSVLLNEAGLFVTSQDKLNHYNQRLHYKTPFESEFKAINYLNYGLKYCRVTGLYYKNHRIYSSLNYGFYVNIDQDKKETFERCAAIVHTINEDSLEFSNVLITNFFASLGPKIAISDNKVMISITNAHQTSQDSQVHFNTGALVLFKKKSCEASFDTMNLSACDNYIPPSLHKEWNVSGQYKDTFVNENHCITYLDVDLDMKYSTFQSIDTTVCGNYMVPSKKRVIQSPGSYWDTIPNSVGCDSVIFIYLQSLNTDASIELVEGVLTANNNQYPHYYWINCINGDTIPTENSSSFRPTEPGLYALTVSDGRCSNTSACYNITENDLRPSELTPEIKVYPNPSNGLITLEFKKSQEDINVEIYNAYGQKVEFVSLQDLRKHEIELPHESGLYFIRINASDYEETVVKVVRE